MIKILYSVCNGVNGMKCIFPYIIYGSRRNMCFQGGGGPACATGIDANGNKAADSYADDNCFLGTILVFSWRVHNIILFKVSPIENRY